MWVPYYRVVPVTLLVAANLAPAGWFEFRWRF